MELVEIQHPRTGQTATVTVDAFEGCWKALGWAVVTAPKKKETTDGS